MSELGSVQASTFDKVTDSYEEALRKTQAERDQALQILADAPHDMSKQHAWLGLDITHCRCWKAGL
jgi:hypothetical protein